MSKAEKGQLYDLLFSLVYVDLSIDLMMDFIKGPVFYLISLARHRAVISLHHKKTNSTILTKDNTRANYFLLISNTEGKSCRV